MSLTPRQQTVLLAALSYAYSNVDDLNEALASDIEGKIKVGEQIITAVAEDEIDALMCSLPVESAPAPVGPRIDLCFSGHLRGVRIDHIDSPQGDEIDTKKWSAEKVVEALKEGHTVALGDILYQNANADIELFDFDVSK